MPTLPYIVSFDTKEMPGKTLAVAVELKRIFLKDNEQARVDLRDHPLYHDLYAYCIANPPLKQE